MFGIIRLLIHIARTIIELLLVFRFVFKLLAANTGAPFVAWIYSLTDRLVAPFAKILPNWKVSGFVIDSATLVAIIVYAIVGSLLLMIIPRSPGDRYVEV